TLSQLLKSNPDSPEATDAAYIIGNIYMQLQRADTAALYWKLAATNSRTTPSTVSALYALTVSARGEKQYADALTFLKRISTEFSYTTIAETTADARAE